jgi:hypothetical protein
MPSSKDFFKKFKGDVWIETGTYMGAGVLQAIDAGYNRIVSIELSEQFANSAKDKFKTCSNVEIINNNAHEVLFDLLCTFSKDQRLVFWLDAHYSMCGTAGENDPQPLLKELAAIEKWKKLTSSLLPIILIDDMRTFNYTDCTFGEREIKESILRIDEKYLFTKHDGFQENTQRIYKNDILAAIPEHYVTA